MLQNMQFFVPLSHFQIKLAFMVKSPIFSLMRIFFGNEAYIFFFLEKVYIFSEICTFLCLGVYFHFPGYLVLQNVHFDRTCGNFPKYVYFWHLWYRGCLVTLIWGTEMSC